MSAYRCSHCGKTCDSIFDTFLYVWTDHYHSNLALSPMESKWLLRHSMRVTVFTTIGVN